MNEFFRWPPWRDTFLVVALIIAVAEFWMLGQASESIARATQTTQACVRILDDRASYSFGLHVP